MASTSLGGHEVSTVAGSVSGVTASLSHEFAERGRSCVEAGAKDLAFTVTYCPGEGREKGMSVVLDTQLSGQFRLDAFSAWLIFTSVWIDNAPSLDIPARIAIPDAATPRSSMDPKPVTPLSPRSAPLQTPSTVTRMSPTEELPSALETGVPGSATEDVPIREREKLGVVAIVRFRAIDFDANIAISRAKLEISPIVLRTVSNGEKTEVDLRIGKTQVTAEGDISGNLCSDRLSFNTVRLSSRATGNSAPTVLAMSIDAGDLSGNLFLGDVNILRFQ